MSLISVISSTSTKTIITVINFRQCRTETQPSPLVGLKEEEDIQY